MSNQTNPGIEEMSQLVSTPTLNVIPGPWVPPPPPSPPDPPQSFLSSLWTVLDGNKTTIGAVLLIAPDIFKEAGDTLVQLGVPADKVTKVVGAVVLVGGLVHKIVKLVRAAQTGKK